MPMVRQSLLAIVLKKLSQTGGNYAHWRIITWAKRHRSLQYVALFPARKHSLMSPTFQCSLNRSQVEVGAVAAKLSNFPQFFLNGFDELTELTPLPSI